MCLIQPLASISVLYHLLTLCICHILLYIVKCLMPQLITSLWNHDTMETRAATKDYWFCQVIWHLILIKWSIVCQTIFKKLIPNSPNPKLCCQNSFLFDQRSKRWWSINRLSFNGLMLLFNNFMIAIFSRKSSLLFFLMFNIILLKVLLIFYNALPVFIIAHTYL